jgi:hypothetical protein
MDVHGVTYACQGHLIDFYPLFVQVKPFNFLPQKVSNQLAITDRHVSTLPPSAFNLMRVKEKKYLRPKFLGCARNPGSRHC